MRFRTRHTDDIIIIIIGFPPKTSIFRPNKNIRVRTRRGRDDVLANCRVRCTVHACFRNSPSNLTMSRVLVPRNGSAETRKRRTNHGGKMTPWTRLRSRDFRPETVFVILYTVGPRRLQNYVPEKHFTRFKYIVFKFEDDCTTRLV